MGMYREWSEIKKDLQALIERMNCRQLEEASEIIFERMTSIQRERSREALKKFKVGDKVKYFSSRGGPYAPKQPDLRGVVEKINLEFGMLWIRKEDGETDVERAIDVRKVSEKITETDVKHWPV